MTDVRPEEFADVIGEQTADLCGVHDHVTRVIANLDIPTVMFSDYANPDDADFTIESAVLLFLYKETRGFNQSETVRRLKGAAYVYMKFDLGRPPTQASLSWMWRNRFNLYERQIIEEAAARIREVCEEHDVVDQHEPALDPDDINGEDISEEQIQEAVSWASELCFEEFTDPRAANAKYEMQAYFERQGYLNMSKAGMTTERRRFARVSDREEVPHGSSHNRTMKKVADPERQTDLWDFVEGGPEKWKRIRDAVLPAFHSGVDNLLEELEQRDREGIKEPVAAALDITAWNFWSSPFKDEENVEFLEEPVEIEYKNDSPREVYPKEDFPEMVSGLKDRHERGFKFATLSIVAEDTPIIVAIEPVRDHRKWEPDDIDTRSRGELVDRLLEQAKQHVDINKLYADREFDSYEVRHVVNQHDVFYVLGKRKQADADNVAIKKTIEHDEADVSVEQGALTYEGETHKVSFIYVPKDTANDKEEYIEGDYAIFTVNAWVGPDRGMGLTELYRDRWMIENEYKSIKQNFLPKTATTDYRNRFLYFTIGVMMYNVWRLTNFIVRDEVDVHLGESPPIPAGEIVELIGISLFDPGG